LPVGPRVGPCGQRGEGRGGRMNARTQRNQTSGGGVRLCKLRKATRSGMEEAVGPTN
jgi:hypothetical protein